MKHLLRLRRRYLALLLCLLPVVVSASIALAFPTPSMQWLSWPYGTGSDAEATQYYATIFAPDTFAAWKAAYGFDGVSETRAVYYNAGDLGFGRDMHCRRHGNDIACYVANHGLGPGGPPDLSVEAAIAGQNALPFVAMVYKDALQGNLNDVSYYIYDHAGNRVNKVALDSDGDKYAPHLCLPCHGGSYDSISNSVSAANFLPFDAPSFKYSQRPGYTLADQQEEIRQLNAIVSNTNPNRLIVELIEGWYAATGGVYQPGSTLDGSFVAPGYAGNAGLYDNVIKPYCRSCHIAQAFTLETPSHVGTARAAVFARYYMPHAEMTSHNFWTSSAPAYLANDRGWSLRVTRLDDPPPDACVSGDCSLREAILAANANPGQDIITFDVDGIFGLSWGAINEDFAFEGDLDIISSTLILGNGADRTILDGNSLDRVFDIFAGVDVVIQGVTIQNGSVADHGGGIYNTGGSLVLNASVVKDNVSSLEMFSGAGIVGLSGATTEINNSTIGPGNTATYPGWGGGIFVSGSTLILNNSTVSGNQAEEGAGIYISGSGVVTINHGTITGNQAASMGGGMRNAEGAVAVVKNTIIAGNSGGGTADCAGSFTSLGHNLVGQNGSANGCSTVGTDIVLAGAIGTALDTNLVAHEGAVPYHALAFGGPAIDAIPLGAHCVPPSYDQRNLARPLDGNADGAPACDIGAYEAPAPWSIFLPLVRK